MSSEYRACTVLARNAAHAHQSCAKRSRSNEFIAVGTAALAAFALSAAMY